MPNNASNSQRLNPLRPSQFDRGAKADPKRLMRAMSAKSRDRSGYPCWRW